MQKTKNNERKLLEDFTKILTTEAKSNTHIFSKHYLKYDNPKHIRIWYNKLDRLEPGQKLIHLAPRGHAKTVSHTINYVLRKIIENHNIRINIVSNTVTQASAFLFEIKQIIESNEMIREDLQIVPNLDKWAGERMLIKRSLISKDPTISVAGVGGAMLTRRADLIVFDDILDEENTASELQREKVKNWFWKTAMPVLVPNGIGIMVGTRWSYADLYGELLKNKDFIPIVDKAIINEETKEVLWPEEYSYEELMKRRENSGSIIFNCSYQNNPTGMQGFIFKLEWFKYYEYVNPNLFDYYIGLDPAISQKETADYSVIMVVAKHKETGNIYVVEYVREHLTVDKQIEVLFNKIKEYNPKRINIETVAYQEALKQLADRVSKQEGIYAPIYGIRTDRDKVRRANALSPMFENGTIYIKKDMIDLIDELTQFPKGAHDDLFDGLELAIDGIKKGSGAKPTKIYANFFKR